MLIEIGEKGWRELQLNVVERATKAHYLKGMLIEFPTAVLQPSPRRTGSEDKSC